MRINHITVLVADNKASAEYYVNVLEMGEVKLIGENHYWLLIGDVYIHLTANSGKTIKDTFYHFAVEIDDLPSYLKKIESKGIEIKRDGLQFFIHDLDGNMIELIDTNNKFFK